MKNIFLVFMTLGFSLQSLADACGPQTIQVGSKQVELVRIEDNEMISGIYKFVRKGQRWNVYRCADDIKKDSQGNPILNLNKCVIKNDWSFGNIVKRDGNSGIVVRQIDPNTGQLEIRLNVGGGEDLDFYEVKPSQKGLTLIANKFMLNKKQAWLSRHYQVPVGGCGSGFSDSDASTKPNKSGSTSKKTGVSQ